MFYVLTILSLMTAAALGKDPTNVLCHESQEGLDVFVGHPIDCGLFYQCNECDCALMTCPDQLYFDSTLSACNWPENVQCQSGYIKESFKLATLDQWGPLFRISLDLVIYYKVNSAWSSVLAFKGNGAGGDFDKYGDRIPAIFYHSEGYLHFTNGVSGNTNYQINYGIDLSRWYHIEIVQSQMNDKVYFTVNINGEEVESVENTDARAFNDVQVFAGDTFYPSANGSYRNLSWELI